MKKFTLILLLLTSALAYSAELIVNQSGLPGSYLTIQSAIDAANPGDIILLDDGDVPYGSFTIDKDITIQPFNSSTDVREVITPVINITIIGDSINQVVLNSLNFQNINVQRNDSLNHVTYLNVINCDGSSINARIPKVSLNLYYSSMFSCVSAMHGQFIANTISCLLIMDGASGSSYSIEDNDSIAFATYYFNNSWANVTISDSIVIIANRIDNDLNLGSKDFLFVFLNNDVQTSNGIFYLHNEKAHQLINNNFPNIRFRLNYHARNLLSNFSSMRFLNNYNYSYVYADFYGDNSYNNPTSWQIYNTNKPVAAYNYSGGGSYAGYLFNLIENGYGPGSPSNEFLNLDLTRNIQGINGGSYAWDNYYSQNSTGNSRLNKARIVDLNLPTQIFDPANISIKVKATHKN